MIGEVIKKILTVNKKYAKREALGLVLTILFSASVFASTLVSRYLIDDVLPTKSFEKLIFGMTLFLVGCIGQPIFQYTKNNVFNKISEDITLEYRKVMFTRIIEAPMKFFDSCQSGALVSRIANDGRTVSDFITNFFVVYVKNVVLVILILGGMLYMSPVLTAMVAVLFALSFFISMKLTKRISELSQSVYESYDKVCVKINQSVRNICLIKNFGKQRETVDDFEGIISDNRRFNIKIRKLNNLVNSTGNAMTIISLALLYGVGTCFVMKDICTIGTIIAFGLFFQNLAGPISELMSTTVGIKEIAPAIRRIEEFTRLAAEESDIGEHIYSIGKIEFKDVKYSYDKDAYALNGVSFSVSGKGTLALIGDSGAGKSTITKLISRYYTDYEGSILINDREITDFCAADIRERISVVSQDTELFNDTIMNNIKMGKEISDDYVFSVCKSLNIYDYICSLEKGFNTVISEKINLSGGERQRVALARALLKNASVYILDEPTASLDPINAESVKRVIDKLSKKKFVILVTHDMDILEAADEIFVMRNGKIEERGSYEELNSKDSYFKELIKNYEETETNEEIYRGKELCI